MLVLGRAAAEGMLPQKEEEEVVERESDPADPVVTFQTYAESYAGDDRSSEESRTVEYFVDRYERCMGKDHPRLHVSTWRREVGEVLVIEDVHGSEPYPYTESLMPEMIDDYFRTSFDPGCDYALPHFNSGQIKAQRVYALNHRSWNEVMNHG